MTKLTHDVRNFLAGDSNLTTLLGSNKLWDTWIFEEAPRAEIENTSKVLVVVSQGPSGAVNAHNTMKFPSLYIDIWADSTRNPDRSVRTMDADDKIEAVADFIRKNLHTVNLDSTDASYRYTGDAGFVQVWGTDEQILERTGVFILGGILSEPDYYDVDDAEGTRMGRMQLDLTQL